MKKNIITLITIALTSCVPYTEIISTSRVIEKDFTINILKFKEYHRHGNSLPYFDGKEGKVITLIVTIKNETPRKKKLDFKEFSIDNDYLKKRIPVYYVQMPVTYINVADENKIATFYERQKRKLCFLFITPKEGKVNNLYYGNEKIELKYGKTR